MAIVMVTDTHFGTAFFTMQTIAHPLNITPQQVTTLKCAKDRQALAMFFTMATVVACTVLATVTIQGLTPAPAAIAGHPDV